MPLSGKDENGLLDGINAAAIDKRLSFVRAINKETGDPVLILCCTFNLHKPVMVPIAEMIIGKDLSVYAFPDEIRGLLQTACQDADIGVGIPGHDTL